MRLLLLCLLLVGVELGAPKNYVILKLPAGAAPTIDGDLTEWGDAYFIDTLYSDDNCLGRDADTPWNPAEFQMKLYGVYDSAKVYFAFEVINDDSYIIGHGWSADNVKVDPGGQAMAFYLNSDESAPVMNPSSPFQMGISLWAASKTHGYNNALPTYEYSVSRNTYDPYRIGTFRSYNGTEEIDSNNQCAFLGIGVEYKGSKTGWSSSSWDYTRYCPTYTLGSEVGPTLGNHHAGRYPDAVEDFVDLAGSSEYRLEQNKPNPCNPTTVIRFALPHTGDVAIRVFDTQGRCVRTLVNGTRGAGYHSVVFDGLSQEGRPLASGVYVYRMEGKGFAKTRSFALMK